MTTFPDRNLNQTAVYWASPATTGYGGLTWDTPIEVPCRWIAKVQLVVAQNGEQFVSQAAVQVNQDVDIQGILFLGVLNDLTAAQKADPRLATTAYTIKAFGKVPTIKADGFFKKAYL